MNPKTKKIIIFSVSLIILHILISLIYIPIAKEFSFHPNLSNMEIFMKWFKTSSIILLFPFLYFIVREIKK